MYTGLCFYVNTDVIVVLHICSEYSPILLVSVSEVVHVAAGLGVLCVLVLPLPRLRHAHQFASVLHHELSATERTGRYHTAPFAIEICHL